MKQKHVILRAIGARNDSFLGGVPGASPLGAGPTSMAVEIELLDEAGAANIQKHNDVIVLAPVIPLKLIEPVSTSSAEPAAGGAEWGVHAVRANTSPFSGDGIVVAVLDTGIDASHAAFTGVNLIQKNFTVDADGSDRHGHGTHCAGTILGRDVDGRRIGIARGVKRALIGKVLGTQGGPSEQVVQAIQWAVSEGANVISMSLGIDFPGFQRQLIDAGLPPELATSKALEGYRSNVLLFERIAATVRALGNFGSPAVLVAAAGNESRRDVSADFKIAVSPPAVADGVISVAALAQAGDRFSIAPFSNTGAAIAGPGVGITSAKPGGGLQTMSGTSMATPHVAGVAALWAQKLRTLGSLTAGLLTTRLVASGVVERLVEGSSPEDVGSGLVQAPQS